MADLIEDDIFKLIHIQSVFSSFLSFLFFFVRAFSFFTLQYYYSNISRNKKMSSTEDSSGDVI